MARLNSSNPLVHETTRRKATASKRTAPSPPTPAESPDTKCTGSTYTLSRGSSQRHKLGSRPMFDIFPDPATGSSSSASNSPRRQKKSRTLKTTQANPLLLPIEQPRQRPSAKLETDDYDKENDVGEESFTEPSTSMGPVRQRSPTRQNRNMPRSTGRSRADHRPPRGMNSKAEDEDNHGNNSFDSPDRFVVSDKDDEDINAATEEQDNCGDNSFNSLDGFVVSDNEDISYHETSASETESEKAPTPPPPPKFTRKRLIRGRRPNTDTDPKGLNGNIFKAPLPLEVKIPDAIKSHSTPKETSEHLFQDGLPISTQLNKLALDNEDEPADQLGTNSTPPIIDLDSLPPPLEPVGKRPETPPSSPSRGPLKSPTKEKIRIPPTPHHENADAFWSQTETNHWIDQHSPRKEKPTGRSVIELLKDFDISDEEDSSPNSSISIGSDSTNRDKSTPPKTPKTPSKTAIKKAEAEAKRATKARRESFNSKKASFAETFLHILDNATTGGEVNRLAKSTGGVKITWSKTLQKTAGRAQWRSERVECPASNDKATGASQHIHYATIELAERIIDDEYRLINTLAHEYCHLANFMVSRVIDNPHGASFKAWGKKCAEALKDHPICGGQINVTTKHSYKIDWKYVWACTGCSKTYGRHSKSIDPDRQRCGECKNRLEQIKPKPRMSPQKKMMAQVTKSLAQVQIEM